MFRYIEKYIFLDYFSKPSQLCSIDFFLESRIAWIESITSAELWTLFNSFSIENPDESTCNNFVCKILKESTLQKLVHAINSLSKGVVLTKNTDTTEGELTVSVRVSVVDIIRNEARCHVAKKVWVYT